MKKIVIVIICLIALFTILKSYAEDISSLSTATGVLSGIPLNIPFSNPVCSPAEVLPMVIGRSNIYIFYRCRRGTDRFGLLSGSCAALGFFPVLL